MRRSLFITLMLILLVSSATAQFVLSGVIKDSLGAPLVGATVIIKGTNSFALADANGSFNITAKKALPYILSVSAAGYRSKEIEITESTAKPLSIFLALSNELTEVVITSRRRAETAQDVPIPISVVGGAQVEATGSFNVNRLKELIPTVQLYSSNPRNTTLNVRGLGSTFGLTNDGIDPGVGFYVDGVYFARPAVTTLDFIDVEQIEVLRGPQGTLFGKNTTAGAFNITTRKPTFTPGATFEVSYGNFGFIQAKSSITGGLIKDKLAARLSFSGTQRDGTIYNIATGKKVNDINNLGVRAQFLFTPTSKTHITLVGDLSRQRPEGYAQVVAGVVETKRAAYRQFDQIIKDLNYELPSRNPFDRVIDHNTPWRSGNDLGGVSINIDQKIGRGTLTATTSWRYWNWDPSNDRDFTGLAVLSLSQATSKHQNWTQEIRYAGNISSRLSGVIGVFAIGQDLKTDPYHIEESGSAQWRFSQSTTSSKWKTPGLFDGYGIKTYSRLKSLGAAVFAQVDWAITERLHILPGLRFNYDKKEVDYDRQTYGGLETTDPELLALKNLVYTNQYFTKDVDENNFSGQLTVSYKATEKINAFATYSTSYKPVGVNLGGLPTSSGEVMLDLAQIKPEYVTHYEAGVKTKPFPGATVNAVFHHTNVKDFQTQVQTAEVGVNRGYLANAEEIRVLGVEVDANISLGQQVSLNGALAWTEGEYVSFTNAPVPLEETGSPSAFKDISGGDLPGISKWAGSLGGELLSRQTTTLGQHGRFFLGLDSYFRSSFSSSPSPSQYLNIPGYALVNGRLGFRAINGLTFFVWGRNLFNRDYFEQLLPAAGNAGHYAGVLGDQRTYGVTLRYSL
ncbi:TonB-dependent receptor [Longitalea luteola]|uniref:TonB-dependent receptor n=1 Tax=Longitalea luteola TaxID=2812563 RepID=UPI001A965CF1|nr:TonB-dependent receptor [Longitalea luteola]